jgi:hypothetical protein
MDTQQMMELLLARLDKSKAWQEDMKAKMATKEDRKTDKEEMIQEMRADREQRKAEMEQILSKMEERMTTTQAKTEGKLKELTETIEESQTEPREEMMQPAEEHQVVPREDAVAIPVRGLKRRHRGWKDAAGRHGEPKELNRGDHGSRKKLPAGRRPAVQQWHGSRGTSSGNLGPAEIVDCGRK